MRQEDLIIIQMAQTITDFLEPVIPYLVIGSKRADAEAGKIEGPDIWAIKKKLWEKLCSRERPELKEAAGDMIISPSDPEVKQALTQEILQSLEQDPDLALEISSFMEEPTIKEIIEKETARLKKQRSDSKNKVFEELNKLLEEFLAKKSTVQDLEQQDLSNSGADSSLEEDDTLETSISVKNLRRQYTHIQLNQGIKSEGSPSAIRMAKIAGMNIRGHGEAQKFQARLSVLSDLEGPEKEEFIEKALDFASQIEYGDLRSQALSLIIPYLEEPRRAELIEKALYYASNIQDEDERSLVLSSLVPHLRGPGKERLIEDIFAFALHIRYSDAKFQIISSLIPHLYGLRKNERILKKAHELAYSILSDYLRVQALSLLVPYLDWPKSEDILEEALELASNLKDKDMRPEALSFIIPYLDGTRKEDTIKKACEMAQGIKSEHRREQALSSLNPYLEQR
ncbi:hypothetical protein RSJ42_09000 [Methanosarcina hadiensis]|uniref:hypothetical protein n=1 Tax=Methanosarcina hadiensis TaxID=3078083 RepID=UPI0039775211